MIRYLLLSQLALWLSYGIYRLALARLPHYSINRTYLLLVPLCCLLYPLLEPAVIPPVLNQWEFHWAEEWIVGDETGSVLSQAAELAHIQKSAPLFTVKQLLLGLYVMGFLWVFQFRIRLWRKSFRFLAQAKQLDQQKPFWLHPSLQHSCTFLGKIYLGADFLRMDKTGKRFLLRHEKAHVRLKHSLDLLYLTILETFLWWNPVVYLWRKQLQTLHEFQADQEAAPSQDDLKPYAQVLVALQGGHSSMPFPAFSQHPLTVRILMLKQRTLQSKNWKPYLWMIPAIAALLSLSAFIQAPSQLPVVNQVADAPEVVIAAPTPMVALEDPNLPTHRPVSGRVTSGFGMRFHPIKKREMHHRGTDFQAPMNTPVMAAGKGIVQKLEKEKTGTGYGRYVTIDHQNGYLTKYAQLNEVKVEVGQEIEKGEVIALSGNSGASTAPHLHFEIIKQGKPVDPMTLLK